MARILVVEDDPDIASLLQRGLASAGHTTDWAETAEAALALAGSAPCDAAIIDMMLGDESGAALLADLRARGVRIPAIMLSALARIEDRAEGLEAGAQDYVVKPFQLSELLARLEVQLHRAAPRPVMMTLGGLVYDPASRQTTGSGKPVAMSEREGDLLTLFLANPGIVLTRGEIFDRIWAPQGGSTENVVDVYLGYLRRKLGNFTPYGLQLRTLRGRGFVLSLSEDEG
ncbi:response regulator transcription factor [Paracoccus sp. Z118]|uniref:response regulator transcription factor n=1 Tax=Paracoccus sp. Z118 TaxID=2851017 RepID=UPI001C2BE5B2|nr:response regulator transcription factor [Paracoccus sp. Z118]MBV0892106.1 response regulator transcription factor [Paracoccus sp. Z118]